MHKVAKMVPLCSCIPTITYPLQQCYRRRLHVCAVADGTVTRVGCAVLQCVLVGRIRVVTATGCSRTTLSTVIVRGARHRATAVRTAPHSLASTAPTRHSPSTTCSRYSIYPQRNRTCKRLHSAYTASDVARHFGLEKGGDFGRC